MALRDQPARGVDRDAPADRGFAALDQFAAPAELGEAHHLGLVDLAEGGRVVDLGDVDVLRADAGPGVGLLRRNMGQAGFVEPPVFAAGQFAGPDADGAVLHPSRLAAQEILRTDQHRRSAVADRRAHGPGQRPAHRPVVQHVLDRKLEAVLRLLVLRAVAVVLGRAGRDLALRRAVGLHVIAGLHGVGVHEHRAVRPFLERLAGLLAGLGVVIPPFLRRQLVDRRAVDRHRVFRRGRVEQLLDADGKAEAALAGEDVLPCAVERHLGRGAAALDVDHRHPLREQALAHQRREQDLAADRGLAVDPQAAVGEPAEFDGVAGLHAGVGKRAAIGFAGEIAIAFFGCALEAGRTGANDPGVGHVRGLRRSGQGARAGQPADDQTRRGCRSTAPITSSSDGDCVISCGPALSTNRPGRSLWPAVLVMAYSGCSAAQR